MAQRPFEGRVHYQVTYLSFPDGVEGVELALPQSMTLVVRGHQYRMEQTSALAGELVIIHQPEVDSLYQLFEFMDRTVYTAVEAKRGAAKYRVKREDAQQSIAGVPCRKLYLQSSSGRHQYAWADTKHQNPLTLDFPSLAYFPLVFEQERNGIWMRFEAVKVVEEPLDDTYFTIPDHAVRIDERILQKIMN